VRDALTEHRPIHIGMRIDVHHPDRSVSLGERPHDRVRDGVVTAHREWDADGLQQFAVVVGDDVDARGQVEGVQRDVSAIADTQAVEGGSAGGHVVGPKQARFGTYLARSESGAGTIRRADVERHSHECSIEGTRRWREAHHGRRTREARHHVAAEWLGERTLLAVGHGSTVVLGWAHVSKRTQISECNPFKC
jgi:hypothetical protein